jgi:hypothetical protein
MPVSIHFRGPMLFVIQESQVQVLIPYAEVAGDHPDRSTATPHYAWLAAWPKGEHGAPKNFVTREALTGVALTLEGGGEPPAWNIGRTGAFDFTAIAAQLGSPRDDPFGDKGPAAVVNLRGGHFEVWYQSQLVWDWVDVLNRVNGTAPKVTFRNPATELKWTCNTEELKAVLELREGHKRSISLTSDLIIRIANDDERHPEGWPDEIIETPPETFPSIDDDFKWVYALFPDENWEKTLRDPDTGGRLGLPAPTVRRHDVSGLTGSCNFAVIHPDTEESMRSKAEK